MKLWEKTSGKIKTRAEILVEKFTAGKDRKLDHRLASCDVLASIAHVKMLRKKNLLPENEAHSIIHELKQIYSQVRDGRFSIGEGIEDVHSQLEMLLTNKLGDAGKKVHMARSRNDQVLTDLKLFMRDGLADISEKISVLFYLLIDRAEENKNVLMPGYTHFQVAMPSSFGLWFSAYAEGLSDDLINLDSAYRLANKNPLGSAAGFGSSFDIDRTYTTSLLGFESLHYNTVNAQMSRGKTEKAVTQAIAQVAQTLARFSYDCTLFLSQNFSFISLDHVFTTGSSIMPHKKNPDVFELVRAKCNAIQAIPAELTFITGNLPSGYFRDMQATKEPLFRAFDEISDCLEMITETVKSISVRTGILKEKQYEYLFTVESVNELVKKGFPFRDAYKMVGLAVESGNYEYSGTLEHTHEGSIGNLCLEEIKTTFENNLTEINRSKRITKECYRNLLQS